MDADLIMLCLNHLKLCKNIYLYRETPLFIKSLDNDLNPEENYLININLLGNEIYKTITNNDVNLENYYHKIEDYIFICFLLGNDFLPHFPALNIRLTGFTILLELYKQLFNDSNYITYNKKLIIKI